MQSPFWGWVSTETFDGDIGDSRIYFDVGATHSRTDAAPSGGGGAAFLHGRDLRTSRSILRGFALHSMQRHPSRYRAESMG